MEIRINFKGIVYSLCIGHDTPWFGQTDFITLTKVYYRDYEVVHAEIIF